MVRVLESIPGIRDDLKTTTTRGFPVAAKLKWAELQQKNLI